MGDKTSLEGNNTLQSQAEQQVARLEREVESLRARLKAQNRGSTPITGGRGKSDELEARNFQLEEQVKDLKFQLSSKQNEASKIQETLTKRSGDGDYSNPAEYEDKLKKMRGIFAQASKQLDEYRTTIATKDKELAELKREAEAVRNLTDDSQTLLAESQKSVERLSAELKSQMSVYTTQIDQLESKLRQSTTQLEQVRTEYQQYKQRANALLQQKINDQGPAGGSKIGELEARLKQLELENIDKSAELKTSYDKLSNAEKDLEQAIEQISLLERDLEKVGMLEKENQSLRERLEELMAKARSEKAEFESELQAQEQRHAATIQLLRGEIKKSSRDVEERLAEKEAENEDLQRISEHLSNQLSSLREEFLKQTAELQEAMARAGSSPKARARSSSVLEKGEPDEELVAGRNSIAESETRTTNGGGPSLSQLLASDPADTTASFTSLVSIGTGARPSSGLSTYKEKDYEMKLRHLAELLNESEVNVQRLTEQEKVLKEEIREMERSEKRQDLKVDYLKSVVLKFFEVPGPAREPLIPVISKVLYLSPEEEKQLHKASVQNGSIPTRSGMLW